MNAGFLPVLLAVGLVVSALGGPWLLRRSVPALAHVPRLAVGMLAGSILVWLGSLFALGPMLAWVISGPELLSGYAGEICRRCLASASPFATSMAIDTMVPAVLLFVLPTLGALAILGAALRHALRRHKDTRATATHLAATTTRLSLFGHPVLLMRDTQPIAFALPRREGGIVVSDGTLAVLDIGELAAVIEHEQAHLRQHHHLIKTLVEGITLPLRWIPLVAAAADAIPHYLEVAADNTARRRTGTPALASALLKLGGPVTTHESLSQKPAGHLLHAAGPNRIRHLVAPAHARAGAGPAFAAAGQVAALAAAGATIHLLYLCAVITGCT